MAVLIQGSKYPTSWGIKQLTVIFTQKWHFFWRATCSRCVLVGVYWCSEMVGEAWSGRNHWRLPPAWSYANKNQGGEGMPWWEISGREGVTASASLYSFREGKLNTFPDADNKKTLRHVGWYFGGCCAFCIFCAEADRSFQVGQE